MLGEEESPAQWKCPYDEDKQEIAIICMDNTRIRKVIDGFDKLIGVCFPEGTKEETQWKKVIKYYKKAINRLRSREDLSHAEVYLFQKDADIFFQEWVGLHGVEGVTNYIHMLGAGHLAEYLFYWKNLYQHSQQGWEAFNSLLKNYYFKRTQRGGTKNRSRLIPIARWLQRRMMFMVGFDTKVIAAKFYGTNLADNGGDQGANSDDNSEI
jgi:hypothetical protein